MAERLSDDWTPFAEEEKVELGAGTTYPLAEWLDGGTWILKFGVDFHVRVPYFRKYLNERAQERDMLIPSGYWQQVGSLVRFRAVPIAQLIAQQRGAVNGNGKQAISGKTEK